MVKTPNNFSVLIVCTGNICRSPTAEVLLRHHLHLAGLEDQIEVDSAGTDGYHVGQSPSHEAVSCAAARGYDMSALRARAISLQDFEYFDLMLAMEQDHLRLLRDLHPRGVRCNLRLFLDVLPEAPCREVADPYRGTRADYETMLDVIEMATPSWIDAIKRDYLAHHGLRP